MAPTMFPDSSRGNPLHTRFVPNHRRQPVRWQIDADPVKAVLIFTDGAAPNNGRPDVREGWGVVTGPVDNLCYSFRPENNAFCQPTSNRAELGAAEAGIRVADWKAEGFNILVIATDSEYVAKGATEWIKGWRDSWTGQWPVERANMDLWDRLMNTIQEKEQEGVRVMFYLIDRQWNRADPYAKAAAGY